MLRRRLQYLDVYDMMFLFRSYLEYREMAEEVEIIRVQVHPDGRMDTHNAGLFLGLSPKTLAMMRSAGTGPRFLKCGRVFYFKDDLQEWLAKQPRVRSTSEARARTLANAAN